MHTIQARNVNDALPAALRLLRDQGYQEESRNGPVMVSRFPVTTMYGQPTERVCLWPQRDANPFFHLFESLWMLAGRNDVEYPMKFASGMKKYSDDGRVFWGAYGFRWRHWFGYDQLKAAITELKENPKSRRVVVQMWDGDLDFNKATSGGLDVPCNMAIHFQIVEGKLNMSVFNRSNDIIWGAYGANVVHMSILQEYMAAAIGVPVGFYWQVSNNWHAYLETLEKCAEIADEWDPLGGDPYSWRECRPFPLVGNGDINIWDQDLTMFLDDPYAVGFRFPFFRKICTPMYAAFQAWKENEGDAKYAVPLEILQQMPDDNDWRGAADQFIILRRERARAKQD